MKVILIKDVARLGRRSEVKEVPTGHALNFLIPKKLAIIATPESLKRVHEEHKKHEEHALEAENSFKDSIQKLSETTVVIPVEANEKGNLFKGINADDILKHLNANNFAITKNHITLEHPIKQLGIHEIGLAYGPHTGVCKLEVVKK